MVKLSGNRDFTDTGVKQIRAAFSFLNEDGSPATNGQVRDWIDRQVVSKVRQHYERLEGAKASSTVQEIIDAL